MTAKQINLIISWCIIVLSLYFVFNDNMTASFSVIIFALFFRDYEYEKNSIRNFHDANSNIVQVSKYYAATSSFVMFVVTMFLLVSGDHEILRNYNFVGGMIFISLWPFVMFGICHEIVLFKKYGSSGKFVGKKWHNRGKK